MRLAELLHDIGHASVPNGIWEAPGALDAGVRDRAQLHAFHGERILLRSPLLARFATIAGQRLIRQCSSPRGIV